MPKKKKQDDQQVKGLNKTLENIHDKNENRKDNNTGAVNEGNLVNSGHSRNKRELHTKSSVLGSDSDGQAD